MWMVFAVLSAVFAALTSILARVGIDGVNSGNGVVGNKCSLNAIDPVIDPVKAPEREKHRKVPEIEP